MVDEPKPADPTAINNTGWMSDVQRALALLLIGGFVFVSIFSTVCSIFAPSNAPLVDMAKTLQQALVNMSLIALGFFFGNTMAKMAQDVGQQKVVEKLTSPPPQGPVAPVPSPPASFVVVSWWSLMEPDEKAAIEARSKTDDKIKLIYDALISGNAQPPDIAALIAAGLLKPERAAQFKTV